MFVARTLKERIEKGDGNDAYRAEKEGLDHQSFKPKENNNNNEVNGEVFSMDYTPARRKPPIHN